MGDISSICVYCGSRKGFQTTYESLGIELGKRIGKSKIKLIYGGGREGIMGVVASSALKNGGMVTGIIPKHLYDIEMGYEGISELIVVDNMHTRKIRMFDLSDAFIILPGGIGTLEEAFEILSWHQLGLHSRPILILDDGLYWQPLQNLIEHIIRHGFADPAFSNSYKLVTSVDEAFRALDNPSRD